MKGNPVSYPVSPALPKSRLSNHHPFKHTGLDYAGPLHVQNVYHGGSMYKAWVFLFTCTSTRALHLDLVSDASSSGCIRSFRRFFIERGITSEIISDNGSQFIAEDTQRFSSNRGIKWHFNLEAPWWGGILSYDELLTVLAEIQAVIINRPLTFLCENIDHLQRIINHYWNRWKCEYLTELREYHRVGKSRGETSIRINDVILIEEAKQPRQNWKMGVVEEFVPSRDGEKRGAVVRYVLNGNTHTIGPINKLYPVEFAKNEAEKKEEVNITFIDENDIITDMIFRQLGGGCGYHICLCLPQPSSCSYYAFIFSHMTCEGSPVSDMTRWGLKPRPSALKAHAQPQG
ncbi:uncharacterized protein LOC130636910 [Hydractinia symbiolongicarpus]|uniref:uncharacterized protein LOC130636910 n=1 Tax=Hydractinia symbiolongicarpus TaxID=13093 RepID=UPI00254BF18C|nr:uncharacterized protein LOC130636910 [Hydractinia symbiolongicarpus]